MARRLKTRAAPEAMKLGDRVIITRRDEGFNIYAERRLVVTSIDGSRVSFHDERALQSVMYDVVSGTARGYHTRVDN